MGLVDSDCRTNNSVQHLQGERKEKVSVASQHSATGAGVCVCVCSSVCRDKLPALRKSLVWLTINLSGDTQKSLVPCRENTTLYRCARPKEVHPNLQQSTDFRLRNYCSQSTIYLFLINHCLLACKGNAPVCL